MTTIKESDNDHEDANQVKYANKLLDREVPQGYAEEWTSLLMREKESEKVSHKNTVVIFRLGMEWFALSALIFKEVAENRIVHKLPHKSNQYLKGVVNIRGRLRLCVSLFDLLEIEMESGDVRQKSYDRIIVLERDKDVWVFPVDEIFGIYRFDAVTIKNVPVTVSKAKGNYLKGMVNWEEKLIGYIDEDLLLNSLKRVAL